MALTSTPCCAFSWLSALVSARPAARLTLVGVELALGALAPMFSTLTMRPHLRSRMPGSASAAEADGGEQFEVEIALPVLVGHRVERLGMADAGIVHHDVDLAEIGHDLLAGLGDRLRLGDVAGIGLELAVGLARGLRRPRPWPSASASALRASIATEPPEAANSLAIARPRPVLAPVITATRPSMRTSISSSPIQRKADTLSSGTAGVEMRRVRLASTVRPTVNCAAYSGAERNSA